MTTEQTGGACTPSFSSAELERLWEEACQRTADRFGMRRAVLREDIDEVRQEFATLVAAAEREACAAECERMVMYPGGRQEAPAHDSVWHAARAIRERSN